MPPKKTANGQADGIDGTTAGVVTILVSPPHIYLFLNDLEQHSDQRDDRAPRARRRDTSLLGLFYKQVLTLSLLYSATLS